jgi:nucleoside-diphosphate-sugar epimerase
MKILITGIGGFIGGQLALMFLKKGFKVRGTVRDCKDV